MAEFVNPEVTELIEKRDWVALRGTMADWPAAEVADLMMDMDKSNRVLLYRALPRAQATDVFSYFEPDQQDEFLEELTGEETRHLMANLKPDVRTALLEELPGQVTKRLLNLLSPEDLREARHLLGYPEGSIGRLMTPDYVAVHPDWTVAQVIEHLRRVGRDSETMDVVYVIDDDSLLLGAASLRQLLLESPSSTVGDIMTSPAVSILAGADREEAAVSMQRHGMWVLPVVDSDGVLVGIVTGDDVLDVIQEEATEDFHKRGAVTPLKVSVKGAGVRLLYRNRVAWLLGLVGVYLLTAGIMARFESVISTIIPLVFFLPILIDTAGNAGSQSCTLAVRAIAMGEIGMRDWASLVVREVGVSAAISSTLGLITLGMGAVTGNIRVGVVAALSMAISVTLSSVIGIMIPFGLQRLRLDPAAASTPLVTSIADILGVIVYFSLARSYFGI